MTLKADLTSFTPTATAEAAFEAKGTNLTTLMGALQQQAIEMQANLKQILAYHPNDSVLAATVVSGGSGGTNGQVVITGTTGTSGTGKFTAKGTIVGGALSGALTVVNAGSYTTDPTSLSAEPISGGGLSGATVVLTMSGDNAALASLSSILAELL